MNLLIKDVELPKAGELWLWLAVNSDGTVSVYEYDKNVRKTTASEWRDGKMGFRFDENGKKIWSTVVEDESWT